MGRGAARLRPPGRCRGQRPRRACPKGRSLGAARGGPAAGRERAARGPLPGARRRRAFLSERQHYNVTLAILTFAGIAFALQQTMVVPALPALREELHTTTGWATWLLTGFLLSASVATPLLGKLGDQYGKERLLVIALGIFFVGCLGAAVAPNIWVLIGFRMVQGTGGAVFPLSFAIIKDEFPPEKVGVAVGIVSSVFAVGGGLGLVLSGLIVDHLSWRWLFIIGAAGVGLAALLVHRFVPESPIKTESRLAVPGAVLLSVGLGSDRRARLDCRYRAPGLGRGRTPRSRADGGHEDACPPARAADESDRVDHGLCDVRVVRPHPELRRDSPRPLPVGRADGRLRLRSDLDAGGALPLAGRAGRVLLGAPGRAARAPLRLQVAARARHAARLDRDRTARAVARPPVADRARHARSR